MFILVSFINHFPGWLSGASGEGGEGGGGVPAVPSLWPLMATSNKRRHSHTDALTPWWAPFFHFLLPFSLYSPLFLPSVISSCALGNVFVSSSSAFSLPLVSSVSGSLTSTLPHLSHSCCLVLSMLCRKQLLNRHFYWSVWKVELLNGRMGYTRSINCVLVYSIHNVTHRASVIINGTRELRTLQIAAILTYTSTDLHAKCQLKDNRLTYQHQQLVSVNTKMAHFKGAILLYV